MNSSVNMSELQKVIFVNGIDENDLNYNGGIESLSNNYPFVAFVTTNSMYPEYDYKVSNLWIAGNRLTRFIGIDEEHNTINVGDHTLKLIFDYDTGKLGIYDPNTLALLEIKSIWYLPLTANNDNDESYVRIDNDEYFISSKNNIFKIWFEYTLDDSVIENTQKSIENVSKKLNFDSQYIVKHNDGKSISITEDLITEVYEFPFKIKDQTNIQQIIKFISAYSSNKSTSITPHGIYLNPVSYHIEISKRFSLDNQVIIINDETSNISLEQNTDYNVKVVIDDPSNIESKVYHRILCECIINNDTNNTFSIEKDTYNYGHSLSFDIQQNDNSFLLKINDVDYNAQNSAKINFKFKYKNESSIEQYYGDYLLKEINVIANGELSDKYFYFGYEDPYNNGALLTLFNDNNIGTDILYDWVDETNPESNYDDKYFYIAIPESYTNIIKPRMDIYEVDDNDSNIKHYYECLNWFEEEHSGVELGNNYDLSYLNGIRFVIYKRKIQGKFYGKIQ